MIKNWKENFISHFKNRTFLSYFFSALFLLLASLVVNYFAGTYATKSVSNSVTDIILSNIRVYDVDGIFNYGAIVFWIFMTFIFTYWPQKIPFTLKTIALFVIIRSVFISLTHIAPFLPQIVIEQTGLLGKFTFGGDLFFSGHTGLPFLMALTFWENRELRIIFIGSSLLFGAVVLLAHIHYSIDVLSAFFITYTIFHLAEIYFKKDLLLFNGSRTNLQ